jgi:signal transduction histidine kinase
MLSLRTASIRKKLFAILVTTTSSALVVTAVFMTTLELHSYRESMSREVMTTVRVIVATGGESLGRGDRTTAETILRASSAPPEILSACLYDRAQALFASYARLEQPLRCPAHAGDVARRPTGIAVHQPMYWQGAQVGSLRVFTDLGELRRRVNLHMLILVLVMAASALMAVLVATRLQRIVSGPILELGNTAKAVSENQNYSLRAVKHSDDEIGSAVDAFNQMLDRIQKADADLRQAVAQRQTSEEELRTLNATLELRIAERTAALQDRAVELKRSNEELESYAYVASHDLQEPLRAIASYTQLLVPLVKTLPDQDARLYIAHVQDGVARMRALISALLDYSRVGRGPPHLRRTCLDQVLETAMCDLETTINETGARVEREPLPTVEGDPVQLGQLFRNLLSNAIKFRGDEPPLVRVSAERQDGEWRVSVSDNGLGIQSQHHDRIFVIFQRLHGRERSGTGIGLAICKRIVERHGGHIWVESEGFHGSTFRFTLPGGGIPDRRAVADSLQP